MKNINLLIIMFIIFIITISFSYILIKSNILDYSVSEEKCSVEGDDCWHSLAHQTMNREFCFKIIDNETEEHCLEHIPETNSQKNQ